MRHFVTTPMCAIWCQYLQFILRFRIMRSHCDQKQGQMANDVKPRGATNKSHSIRWVYRRCPEPSQGTLTLCRSQGSGRGFFCDFVSCIAKDSCGRLLRCFWNEKFFHCDGWVRCKGFRIFQLEQVLGNNCVSFVFQRLGILWYLQVPTYLSNTSMTQIWLILVSKVFSPFLMSCGEV